MRISIPRASQSGSGAQPEARLTAIRAQPDLTDVMNIPGDARIPQARAGWPRSIGNQTMNAFSLYLPERRDFSRWPAWHDDHRRACRHRCLSCVVGCRAPLEPHLIPAIAVTHALVEAS